MLTDFFFAFATFSISKISLLDSAFINSIFLTYYIGIEVWLMLKILFVFALTLFHFVCGRWLASFADNNNLHSDKFYKFVNEIPTIILIIVITLVVFKF